ncbi:recombinase family protein [Microbacterium sp. B24]|nr:recombinase family protein [Microbacterium sp. B24]
MTNAKNKRPRAVLYSRLSRSTIESTSMTGQRDDLYTLAEREGWDIVAAFDDEGKSGGRKRENAEEALRMLRDGEADVLAAYSVDRYSRQGIGEDAEVIRVIDRREAQARRGELPPALAYFAREGIRSDSGSDWRLRFALSSEMAKGERDVMVSRRKASIARLQEAGRFTGRGPAPWGYRSAPNPAGGGRILVVDPTEAADIRAAAQRLIDGESATAVSKAMTRAGVPTPRSPYRLALLKGEPLDGDLARGFWAVPSLIQALSSQSLLGRIARTGRNADPHAARYGSPVLDRDGLPLQAFDPILTLDEHLQLRARFSHGEGRGRQRTRKAARLGSGLVFCGVCDFKVYVVSSQGHAYYRCSAEARGSLAHPGGLRVKADIVEAAITQEYLGAFGRLRAVRYVERDTAPALTEGVAQLTERIQSLSAAIAAPGADVLALAPEIADLQQRRDALLAAPAERTVHREELGGTWADVWASSDVDARRRYLSDTYDHFLLYPADRSPRVSGVLKPSRDEAPEYYTPAPA